MDRYEREPVLESWQVLNMGKAVRMLVLMTRFI